MPVRFTINFTGRVQGVGFRYTTVHVASGFQVAGWVRNEPDGSVQCVAEGEESELEAFISAIRQQMTGYIKSVQIEKSPAGGTFQGFVIRK